MGEEVEPCRKNRKNKAPVQVKQKRTSGQISSPTARSDKQLTQKKKWDLFR